VQLIDLIFGMAIYETTASLHITDYVFQLIMLILCETFQTSYILVIKETVKQ